MPIPKPANEDQRVDALRRFQLLDTPPEPMFDDVVLLASTLCGTPIALITLLDETRQWYKARLGIASTETPREDAFCAYTIMGRENFIVEDATCDARFVENPAVTGEQHIRFYAGAPLVDSEGHALGSLCVIDRTPRTLNPQQQTALAALSRQVIALIEFRRAARELAESLSQIQILQGILPICGFCKSVRNDTGYWESVEQYIEQHPAISLSHGICPTCVATHFADFTPPAG